MSNLNSKTSKFWEICIVKIDVFYVKFDFLLFFDLLIKLDLKNENFDKFVSSKFMFLCQICIY